MLLSQEAIVTGPGCLALRWINGGGVVPGCWLLGEQERSLLILIFTKNKQPTTNNSTRPTKEKGAEAPFPSAVVAATRTAIAAAGWTACTTRATGTRTVVVRARTCVVATGTIAARACTLRTRCARLLAIRVVGAGIGVIRRKAGCVAGVSIGTWCACLAFTLSTLARTLRAGPTWTARLVAKTAFAACGIRTVATWTRTACTCRTRTAGLLAVRLRRTGVAVAGRTGVDAIGHVPAAEGSRVAIRQRLGALGGT